MAERVARITFPRKSKEVQNSFTILHLGNFLRQGGSKESSQSRVQIVGPIVGRPMLSARS